MAVITAQEKYIMKFIKDIKRNGLAYIKSASVANQIKERAPEIEIVWSKEDKTYTAFYNKS